MSGSFSFSGTGAKAEKNYMGLNETLKGLPQGLINNFVGVSSPRLGLSPFNFLILFTRKGWGVLI
jgi:hypothetical protein